VATSGSRDFNLDVAEMIEEAYERCGMEVRTGYDAETAKRSLNLMLAEWANRGLNMWTVAKGTVTLTQGQAQETLGSDVIDALEVYVTRDGTDYEMQRISRGEYVNLPNKSTTGRPTSFWFDRQIEPVINLWPAPSNSTDVLTYYYKRRIEDADALQNTTDMPFRLYPAAVAGLAYYLSLKRAPERAQLLKQVYDEQFLRAAQEDEDRVSLWIVPDRKFIRH